MDFKKNLRQIFAKLEMDKEGNIEMGALRRALKEVGVELPEDALREMFAEVDRDDSGEIDFQHFEKIFTD
eukprot:1291058-Rhodomonas_salina.1